MTIVGFPSTNGGTSVCACGSCIWGTWRLFPDSVKLVSDCIKCTTRKLLITTPIGQKTKTLQALLPLRTLCTSLQRVVHDGPSSRYFKRNSRPIIRTKRPEPVWQKQSLPLPSWVVSPQFRKCSKIYDPSHGRRCSTPQSPSRFGKLWTPTRPTLPLTPVPCIHPCTPP